MKADMKVVKRPVGRPRVKQANIDALKRLRDPRTITQVGMAYEALNSQELLAYTMKHAGCTLNEIGQVLEVTPQRADAILKAANKRLGGGDNE